MSNHTDQFARRPAADERAKDLCQQPICDGTTGSLWTLLCGTTIAQRQQRKTETYWYEAAATNGGNVYVESANNATIECLLPHISFSATTILTKMATARLSNAPFDLAQTVKL